MRKVLGAALAAMLTAGAANATVTLTMSGTRSGSSAITGTSDTFTLTMTYDELAAAVSSTSTSTYDFKRYAALQSVTFSSGSFTQSWQSNTSSTNTFDVTDYKTNSNADTVRTNTQDSSGYIRVNLAAPYTTLDSANVVDFSQFAWTNKSVSVASASSTFGGNITSMSSTTSSVPEPSIWGMMLVGFGAIGLAMRTQRKGEVSFS